VRRSPSQPASLAHELEVVRGEELAQLGVGEQATMRRIPRSLEGVERSSCSGIVGRELVDDEHLAAVAGHPRQLGHYAVGSGDVMERPVGAREVEGAVGEGQRRPVSLDELGVRKAALARELEQLGHRVEADDLAHERRQSERESAGAGAEVERAFFAGRRDEVGDLCREPLGAAVLMGGDTLGRAGESVSRRRHGGHARAGC
jgi:hypothetical protein